jgi:hypothetical protein
MYDRATNSMWITLTGEPVIGSLPESGLKLRLLPIVVTTWKEWLGAHPDTTVLDIDTGFNRRYLDPREPGAVYNDYFTSPDLMFPVFSLHGALPAKTPVIGLRSGGSAKAYPIEAARNARVINDTVGGQEVVIVTDPESGAARAYERQGREFKPGSTAREVIDREGRAWIVREEALVIAGGADSLGRLPSHNAFWFGWAAFNAGTELWSP